MEKTNYIDALQSLKPEDIMASIVYLDIEGRNDTTCSASQDNADRQTVSMEVLKKQMDFAIDDDDYDTDPNQEMWKLPVSFVHERRQLDNGLGVLSETPRLRVGSMAYPLWREGNVRMLAVINACDPCLGGGN